MKNFPDDFLWGASTAAYQVEGGITNQWSEWEHQNAERLAREAPKKLGQLPNWKEIEPQATKPSNYLSGNGIEHYERYEEDFDLLQQLNMNAFRFGVEWARIEPEEGKWDDAAIEHYRHYIQALKGRGIEPVLTLWWWTMPVWFTDKGAFEKRENVKYFERYVAKIAQELGSELKYVLTLNEPNVYSSFSYILGEWPPQTKRPLLGFKVYRNLVHAHRRAYQVLKQINPGLSVGIADQLGDTRAKNPRNPLSRLVIRATTYAWGWWFLNRIKNQSDFIGINYYFTEYRDWMGRIKNPKKPVSDLGWYMDPSGLKNVLTQTWHKYHKPLLVTENGLADATDAQRKWWLEQTLTAMDGALADGVELFGYLHWSLLDNFEWAYGWWPRFGLVAVDRETMQRTIRPSAKWLAEKIKK
ncbi:MAG: glycoside hydrolase family 1 protein [Candidatus Saccharimonadales bacterium]